MLALRLGLPPRFETPMAVLLGVAISLRYVSAANVRSRLRAAMPLPDLTADRAAALVFEHLVNRTRSRRSRHKRQPYRGHDP